MGPPRSAEVGAKRMSPAIAKTKHFVTQNFVPLSPLSFAQRSNQIERYQKRHHGKQLLSTMTINHIFLFLLIRPLLCRSTDAILCCTSRYCFASLAGALFLWQVQIFPTALDSSLGVDSLFWEKWFHHVDVIINREELTFSSLIILKQDGPKSWLNPH